MAIAKTLPLFMTLVIQFNKLMLFILEDFHELNIVFEFF